METLATSVEHCTTPEADRPGRLFERAGGELRAPHPKARLIG